jgi:hypothetical protein
MSIDARIAARAACALAALICAYAVVGVHDAHANDARFEAASLDGSVVFFTTDAQPGLLGDTDLKTDVYARAFDSAPGIETFVTRRISTGPAGGNNAIDAFFVGASEDGSRAFFSTRESLVAEDTDHAADLYLRDTVTSKTVLVSGGEPECADESCGNAEVPANFVQRGVAADGSRVFFVTTERLVDADDDGAGDVYARDVVAGVTELVSQGDVACQGSGCGNGDFPILSFDDTSADGSKVFFRTAEDLTGSDDDNGASDIYRRNLLTGATAQVSIPGDCPECAPSFGAASADGIHVVFETSGQLSPADQDQEQDVYDWSAGVASLASIGPVGGNGDKPAVFPGVVSAFPGIAVDGSRVVFETAEQLVGADDDGAADVYQRAGGETSLVSRREPGCDPSGCGSVESPATFRWLSPDDSTAGVLFGTAEPLVGADADERQDVYRRLGGETTLISAGAFGGNADFNAGFAGASYDGSHVFILTAEPLVGLDMDTSPDIYDVSSGTASLVSTGPAGGDGPFGSGLSGVSESGSHAFFATDERLTVDDVDGEDRDVYQHTASGTLLVSTGNAVLLGPAPPAQLSTDPPSPGASTSPSIHGQADPGSSVQVYTDASCSGQPLRTGTAETLGGPGIPVSVAADSTTSFWLSAEAEGITSACAGPLSYKHSGPSSPGGGSGAGSGGSTPKRPGGGGRSPQPEEIGISYVRPATRITFGPSFRTLRRKVVFRFTDETGQPHTKFRCRLDRKRWRGCRSPFKLARLGPGRHVFRVKGVNGAGEWEASPAQRQFKVVGR